MAAAEKQKVAEKLHEEDLARAKNYLDNVLRQLEEKKTKKASVVVKVTTIPVVYIE